MAEEKPIGIISNYFSNIQVASIKLQKGIKVGDKIKIKGGGEEFEQEIDSMQIQREPVEKAKKGDEIGIKVKEKVGKGYKVFKA